MEVDSDENQILLESIAAGNPIESKQWPSLRNDILQRLEKIALNEFPIPRLPPPPITYHRRQQNHHHDTHKNTGPPLFAPSSSFSSSPPKSDSQEADKENAPATTTTSSTIPDATSADASSSDRPPTQLPPQLNDMLDTIKSHITSFPSHPPHTVQRLAELLLRPTAHYRALASYLHAVDRVVQVTSGTDVFPLPSAVPHISSATTAADSNGDPDTAMGDRDSVSWGQNVNSVGSDEALGGALLTMIPWLARSPDGEGEAVDDGGLVVSNGDGETALVGGGAATAAAAAAAAVQMNSESTETIDGPNGVGSVETVSVSVNGVPSTGGGHITGVTQGELLRQEQKAGVVPVSQLHRPLESSPSLGSSSSSSISAVQAAAAAAAAATTAGNTEAREGGVHSGEDSALDDDDEGEGVPHARGPEEIGMSDTGPQSKTLSYVGDDGVDMRGLNVEAAVGRKAEGDDAMRKQSQAQSGSESEETAGKKREAEQGLEPSAVKKAKEGDDDGGGGDDNGDGGDKV